jgi:CRISPR-associated endonuclease/helicase Cas3
MQEKTVVSVTGPGVYVVEAPMGMGKTEAALWATYRLLLTRKATGIYFALPTQMTSNRIHIRMNEFLRRISPDEASTSRLIHGNSWLFQSDCPIHPAVTERHEAALEDARAGRDWFASTKRALLAPFGVGTVDQALLGVVAAKHFFVRHFALAGKVVILDEIHSYDLYTGTLIDTLIATLEGLGCTIIVLSATLTGKRRGQIVSCHDEVLDDELLYPLITGRNSGLSLEPVSAPPPKSREVRVDFYSAEKAHDDAVALARQGGAVLWICNTVDAAQRQYQQFTNPTRPEFPVGLLHSRFPFWRREELETEWMARFGKDGKTRCGSILVSTQVVEQSVDLDADLLISELAPTDMLLQRLGRLWRHERGPRPVDSARLCILEEAKTLDELRRMEPKAIEKALGGKAQVYAPFVLLRSLELWEQQSQKEREVSIPAQIRRLLELTYQERDDEPDSWQQLFYELEGNNAAIRMKALQSSNIWQVALEDEEGVQTRLNEVPTAALVLCREITAQEAFFINQSKGVLGNGEYRFATAQAIHQNLVKIPGYCFDDFNHLEPCPAFADYVHGKQCLGIVAEDGAVAVRGLKKGIRLFYTDELGLVIERAFTQEEI